MHFSRPLSKRRSSCRPRKRERTGRLTSGYWIVTGRSNMLRKVIHIPRKIPKKPTSTSPDHNTDGGQRHAEQRQREQDLPAEGHQPVIAETRQRRSKPDHQKQERNDLDRQPNRPQQGHLVHPRAAIAAQKEGGGDGADADHLVVLGHEEQGELHSRKLRVLPPP